LSLSAQSEVISFAVSGTILFAGTYYDGVYFSTNDGTSWTAFSSGLTGKIVDALAVIDTNIFAGLRDGGVCRRPLSDVVTDVGSNHKEIPSRIALEQNYPNPFNPNSDIRYQISEFRHVKLAVYDLLGREVSVLVNERKAPGSYTVQFNGSGLASGVYLYRLKAGSFVETKKLVLLK
jgi:hypothetical protein